GVADFGRNGKVNEAFAVGHQAGGYPAAGALTSRIVSISTGLELSGWIALDFAGFQDMVDAVGGITVENPRAFQWALGPEQHARREWAGTFPEGSVKLNGVDALRYARVRYTDTAAESSDFARGARQQAILSAIRSRVRIDPAGAARGLALADALEGHLHTDLSVIDLATIAGHLSPDRRIQLEEGTILEATRNSIGQYVLVVIGRSSPSDYTPLHRYIAEALAGETE
ncbi:MAG: LCP family protein, partial [Chloroflexi bacterium]|nr:LCP family protein [Chloroflexota bacterium]